MATEEEVTYEVTFKNSVLSEVTTTSGGERERIMVKYHIKRRSFQDWRKKVLQQVFLLCSS